MSNEFVMVPRKLTREMLGELTNGDPKKNNVMKLRWEQALKVAPAEQHQGEPVAWALIGAIGGTEIGIDRSELLHDQGKYGGEIRPLYTHADPGALQRSWQAGYDTAWYAKNPAEKRTSVNPANPGEVERLREGISKHWKVVCDQRAELDTLRAQLAERDALLRDISKVLDSWRSTDDLEEIGDRVAAMISASAEPSAPVEFDYRAELQALVETVSDLGGKHDEPGWKALWKARDKARAALERKDAADPTPDEMIEICQKYWRAQRKAGEPGAVKWIQDQETGALMIFTRGEYREQLMELVYSFGRFQAPGEERP